MNDSVTTPTPAHPAAAADDVAMMEVEEQPRNQSSSATLEVTTDPEPQPLVKTSYSDRNLLESGRVVVEDAGGIKNKMEELYNELAKLVSAREDAIVTTYNGQPIVGDTDWQAFAAAADLVAELQVKLEESKAEYSKAAHGQRACWRSYINRSTQQLQIDLFAASEELDGITWGTLQNREALRELDGLHAVLSVLRLGSRAS